MTTNIDESSVEEDRSCPECGFLDCDCDLEYCDYCGEYTCDCHEEVDF